MAIRFSGYSTRTFQAVALGMFFCTTVACKAVTISVTGTAANTDTTLYSNMTSHNAGSTARNRVGRTNSFGNRRMLTRFDLSAVPAGSTITSVTLQLLMVETPSAGPVTTPQNLHRVTRTWVEGTGIGTGAGGQMIAGAATWNSSEHGSVLWTTPGGDFVGASSAVSNVGDTTNLPISWTGAGLVADVQLWHNTPAQNSGWILIGDESIAQSARGYASAEATTEDPPVLFVEYTPASGINDWSSY